MKTVNEQIAALQALTILLQQVTKMTDTERAALIRAVSRSITN